MVVQWLPKRSYADALAQVRSFDSHLGLVYNNGTFGIRVETKDVAAARKVFASSDARFADSNRATVRRRRFEVLGLPRGTTRKEIIEQFSEWKGGWNVLPQRQIISGDGDTIWILLADVSPPERYFEGKNCRVLIQELDQAPRASAKPPVTKKPVVSFAPTDRPSASAPASSSATDGRLPSNVEQRFQVLD